MTSGVKATNLTNVTSIPASINVIGTYRIGGVEKTVKIQGVDLRSTSVQAAAELTVVSARITSVNSRIATVSGNVTSVNSRIAAVSAKGTSVNTKIVTVSGKITSVNSRVATVSGKGTSVNSKLTTASARITSVNSKVVTVSAKNTSINTRLTNLSAALENRLSLVSTLAATASGGGGGGGENSELTKWFNPPTKTNLSVQWATSVSLSFSVTVIPSIGMIMSVRPANTANHLVARLRSAPATPCTIVTRLRHTPENASEAGLILRNSTNNRNLRLMSLHDSATYFQSWSTASAFNAGIGFEAFGARHIWFKYIITAAGSIRAYHSLDGGMWKHIGSTTKNAYITAAGGSVNQVGVYHRGQHNADDSGSTFYYFEY